MIVFLTLLANAVSSAKADCFEYFCTKPSSCPWPYFPGCAFDECPAGITPGYYPDLTSCDSYCDCTGAASSSKYVTCPPSQYAIMKNQIAVTENIFGQTKIVCNVASAMNDNRECTNNPPTYTAPAPEPSCVVGPTEPPVIAPTESPTTAAPTPCGSGFCTRPPGCVGVSCAFNCPSDMPNGYYPDLTSCDSYCKCNPEGAPDGYVTCDPPTLYDPLGRNAGGQASFQWLSGQYGPVPGGLWASTGGICNWPDNVNDSRACFQNPPTYTASASTSCDTFDPSKAPVIAPTDVPTKALVDDPTRLPTNAPVLSSTAPSSAGPTVPSVDDPTRLPTNAPVLSSTDPPTDVPTKASVDDPTRLPTNAPVLSSTDPPTSELPAENDSELPANYFLPAPKCSFDEMNSNTVGDFNCTFSGIISPNHASVLMKVLDHNCIFAYNKTLFGETVVTPTTSLVTNMTSFEAIADVDPSSGHDGDVEFCIRVELLDSSNEVMWYRSEQAKISFSYNGTFIITEFETNPYEGTNNVVTSANKNFGVTADVCDANGTVNLSPAALSIDTNLFVCIRTIVVDTKIQSISSFDAEKKSGENFVIKTPSPNVVVRYLETSSVQVVIKLPALFFANSNNINLSGTVVVTPNSRRHLVISRDLQVQTKNADFGLVVPVNEINDDSFLRTYYGDSSTSTRATMIHTTIFGIFTMCLV